jgi:hypothetical protein
MYPPTTFIAPIWRLPSEILSQIFMHCHRQDPRKKIARLNKAPLLLGSVCSTWRTIALATAQLWASLTLDIGPSKSDVTKAWLARARNCPLTIRVYGEEGAQPLMDVFLLHCEWWYEIHLPTIPCMMGFPVSAKNHLPRLHKLYLEGRTILGTLDIFEFAPQLCSVRLHSKSLIKVPWTQLYYFHMGYRTVDECLELLRATPNLEKCAVRIFDLSNTRDLHPSVQLPYLRSVTIDAESLDLFDALMLPKLQEVSLDIRNDRCIATPQL